MNPDRKSAILAGVLFIVATAAGVLSVLCIVPLLDAPDYLQQLAAHPAQITLGALLLLGMAGACAGIAIALFPVLHRCGETLALGSLVFRAIEGTAFGVSTIFLISLLALGRSAAPQAEVAQALGAALKAAYTWSFSAVGALAFCTGAFLYYILFARSRLIPLWLSIWGLIAILLHAAYVLLIIFGVEDSAAVSILNLPIFLQEMVLAAWLIIKGFNPAVLAAAKTGQ